MKDIFKMKQLWIFVLQGIFVGICEKIDTAFGNNISIDAICVLSAYTIITWVTYCIYQMGSYSYRIMLSKEKNNLLISVVVSLLLSVLVFALSDYIPYIYSLTEKQNVLFSKCLKMHALCIPFFSIGEFIYRYMLIKCMNKLMFVTNVIFYTMMIGLDAIVYFKGYDLDALIFSTFISYLVYDIIIVIYSGILKVEDNIELVTLKECLKHSTNMLIDRLLGKVATVTYNIYASKLGTEMYAIHSVCYSIAVFTEYITNSLYDYQIVRLKAYNDIKDKFNTCMGILKKVLIPLTILGYFSSFLLLMMVHGKVSIQSCIIPLILYCSQVFFIQLYESLRGYLTSLRKSELLKWAGLIGIFVRIPVTLIAYYCNIGIYGFALASSLDFLCRGFYFYICSKRIKISKTNN